MEIAESGPALTFGSDAERYDARRPDYPSALYTELFQRAPAEPQILEVGAGTGQATAKMAEAGAHVLALEPDSRMADVLARKQIRGTEVVVSSFEAWESSGTTFDVIASAQAWHWVDPEIGATKAVQLLVGNGHLALWWNIPAPDRSDSAARLDPVYETFAPELIDRSVMVNARSDGRHTKAIAQSGAFDLEVLHFEWHHVYTADDFVSLLATHSDHHTLPSERRARLFDALHQVATKEGGVRFNYQTECTFASRRA